MRAVSGARHVVVLAAFLLGAAAPRARAQQDSGLIEVLVETRVERGPGQDMVALARDSLLFLPFRTVLLLVEGRVDSVVPGRRLLAYVGRHRLRLDSDSGVASRGLDVQPLEGAVVWRGEEAYVALPVVGRLLRVEVTSSWSDLQVLLGAADALPVRQRIERERRREALLAPHEAMSDFPESARAFVSRRLVDGLAVDWAVQTAAPAPSENTSVQLGIGAAVLGGAFDLQHSEIFTARAGRAVRVDQTLWTWTYAWERQRWLRQLRVGDLSVGRTLGAPVQGAVVTNAPYLRPVDFASQELRGRLPHGWEVEVYRGDRLLGYQPVDADGQYVIDVPVGYGPNPLETRAYGPGGVSVLRSTTFQVPLTRLPAGRLEYVVGVGGCRSTGCVAAVNGDVRYGISSVLTVQAGLDHLWRDSVTDLSRPYALVTGAVTRPLALTAEVVGSAFVRGRVDVDPSPDFHADAVGTRYVDDLIGHRVEATVFWRPAPGHGRFYVQGTGFHQSRGRARLTDVRGSVVYLLSGGRASLGVGTVDAAGEDVVARRTNVADAAVAVVVPRGRFRNTLIRGDVAVGCRRQTSPCPTQVTRWSTGLAAQLGRLVRMEAGLRQEQSTPMVAELNFTIVTAWLRASSRNSVSGVQSDSTGGLRYTSSQLLEGTLLYRPHERRLDVSTGRNLGRGGLAGVIFLDSDGDGARDPDEAVLPGVVVRVGEDIVATDSLGRFGVFDLVPFVDAVIEVDSLGLDNPLWYPAVSRLEVAPSPNSFRFVEVPVRVGGELSGSVVSEGRRVAGVPIELREATTGHAMRATTFSDGSFYIMRVPAGTWDLYVGEGFLRAADAVAVPVRITIGDRGPRRVENVEVQLLHRQ